MPEFFYFRECDNLGLPSESIREMPASSGLRHALYKKNLLVISYNILYLKKKNFRFKILTVYLTSSLFEKSIQLDYSSADVAGIQISHKP